MNTTNTTTNAKEKTTTIRSFSDLRPFGIDLLTGESCALSRRLLCDVTENGKRLVCKALGVNNIDLAPDWNGHEAVGSILLDRETLQTLCILALFEDQETIEVWEDQGSFMALDQERLDEYKNSKWQGVDGYRKYRIPNRSGRNQHQMSGRIS